MNRVTMTDFSTRCWKSARRNLALLLVGLTLLAVWPQHALAQPPLEIAPLKLERMDDGLFLSTQVRLDLPPIVDDALNKGIAMYFVIEADVLRERWYWYDRKVASAARYVRLAYQPLSRRWRLHISPEPIGNAGLGVNLSQYFDTLDEALHSLQRISRWKIADASVIDPDARQSVEFRFKLDMSQMPQPVQIGAAGQADWALSASRTAHLTAAETSK